MKFYIRMVDDNVHVMNTLELAAMMQEMNKKFDMMLYPGNTHSTMGPKSKHYNDVTSEFRNSWLFKDNR